MLRDADRCRRKDHRTIFRVAAMLAFIVIAIATQAAPQKEKEAAKKAKPASPAEPTPQYVELTWPEAPLPPRIKFVDVLASELDLGRKITFRESFMKAVTGKKPQIAHMYQPRDIAVSDDGKRVYASDFGESVVFLFDIETNKLTSFPAESPFGLAMDDEENIYIVEQDKRQIKVVDRAGLTVRTLSPPGLIRPADITIDRARKLLYVADPATKASLEHLVRVYDLQGNLVRMIGNGKGDCEGCLLFPTYVAVDRDGNVYVTSTLNARVDKFTGEGKYLQTIGVRGTSFGMFDKPKGVALDSFGNIYVADSGWSNVQIFNQKGEVLLYFGGRGSYPGLLKNPTGITIAKDNKIYVADYLNYRVVVYQLVNTKAEDSFLAIPQTADQGASAKNQGEQAANQTSAAAQKQ